MGTHRRKKRHLSKQEKKHLRAERYANMLRRNMTLAERDLFSILQCWKEPWKVHPQYVLLGFIVDFAFPYQRVAIEIDGDSHDGQDAVAYDRRRTAAMVAKGWRVLRFKNEDVYADQAKVTEAIRDAIGGERMRCLTVPFKVYSDE